LIYLGDDHSHHDLGCLGSREVATPYLNRIAAEGMTLTHAYTATAMCAPMRQAMLTGMYPVRNGAYPNHSQIRAGIATWPAYFQRLGYRVGLLGKRHFGPAASFPFTYLSEGNADTLDFGPLEEFMAHSAEPFCAFVASNQPHVPQTKGDPRRHPPAAIRVPPQWVDTPQTRDFLSRYYAEIDYLDDEFGQCMAALERTGKLGNTITMYSTEHGTQMPFSKWTCYELGLLETVLVRWPGRIRAGSVSDVMVQGVDWLPTMLEACGGKAPEGIDGRSMLPALVGGPRPAERDVFGVHTTRGIISGSACYPIRSIRAGRHKLILNLNHEAKFQCVTTEAKGGYWPAWVERAKTDAAARRIVERYQWRPAVEFYDLAADPGERNNLAGTPGAAAKMGPMRRRLEAWMEAQGDRGVETEMLVKPNARGEEA
jgi:N-sulfoglucosamine sulfohydrolase